MTTHSFFFPRIVTEPQILCRSCMYGGNEPCHNRAVVNWSDPEHKATLPSISAVAHGKCKYYDTISAMFARTLAWLRSPEGSKTKIERYKLGRDENGKVVFIGPLN